MRLAIMLGLALPAILQAQTRFSRSTGVVAEPTPRLTALGVADPTDFKAVVQAGKVNLTWNPAAGVS
jgi:hypothetical protein